MKEFFKNLWSKVANKAFLKKWWPAFAAGVVVIAVAITLVALMGGKEDKTVYDNETDPLVFATLEVDKVFNHIPDIVCNSRQTPSSPHLLPTAAWLV